jgi:hypothetical protein
MFKLFKFKSAISRVRERFQFTYVPQLNKWKIYDRLKQRTWYSHSSRNVVLDIVYYMNGSSAYMERKEMLNKRADRAAYYKSFAYEQ